MFNFGHEPVNLQLLLFSHSVVFIFHFSVVKFSVFSSLLCTVQLSSHCLCFMAL